jgi:N-acetylglucosamine-6-phosphate deacetylase
MIDVHTHGMGRATTRGATRAAIRRIAAAHGQAGVAAILPTVYAGPIEQMRADACAVASVMREGPRPGEARVLGVHLEGPFLNPGAAGAQARHGLVMPSAGAFNALVAGLEDAVRILTLAPELKGALRVIERAAGMGVRVSLGHSRATYAEGLRAVEAGATGVTHVFNAMSGIHHREAGLAGLALLEPRLYVELIGDLAHVGAEAVRLVFAMKPAGRVMLVSDTVAGPMRKAGALQGGKAALPVLVERLAGIGIPRAALERAASQNPARYLGIRLTL